MIVVYNAREKHLKFRGLYATGSQNILGS